MRRLALLNNHGVVVESQVASPQVAPHSEMVGEVNHMPASKTKGIGFPTLRMDTAV